LFQQNAHCLAVLHKDFSDLLRYNVEQHLSKGESDGKAYPTVSYAGTDATARTAEIEVTNAPYLCVVVFD
jgi:hypothetical protein